jgi:hypothetical protein
LIFLASNLTLVSCLNVKKKDEFGIDEKEIEFMNVTQFKIKSVRNNSTSTEITQLVDLLLSPRDNKNILSPRSKNEVDTVVTSPRKEKRQSFSFFKKRSTSLKPLNLEATNQTKREMGREPGDFV